jgi:DDE superfamily endonuclease
MTKRKIEYWGIPPQADAEFVASMENVLDMYAKPYDSKLPLVCMDEQPVQLLKEIRSPMPATKQHAKRIDYEYERAGTASIFMFAEPLSGWRRVRVLPQRTKVDWAREVGRLLTTRYAKADKLLLVCDNLNTHTRGAFYEAFEPTRAREFVRRLEFCYTPKHGSWLNIAENELSAMIRQCVAHRRFGEIENLQRETTAWAKDVNRKQKTVDWQFTIENARTKLRSLYPKIKF